MHNGVKETLCSLREKHWIARGCQIVKREIHMCNICRKLEGKPYASPDHAPLPDFCVSEEYPFSHTSVDFVGPIYVKTSVRKETEMTKSYIALYTCASTRAPSRACPKSKSRCIYTILSEVHQLSRCSQAYGIRQCKDFQVCRKQAVCLI